MNKNYQPVIGLEIHVELKTKSKMFCSCPAYHFSVQPNTQTCPVCLGLPGALPVPNRKAVEWVQKIGLALNSKLNPVSKFDRKHYFYPDLPKGYQISQYDEPLCLGGYLDTAFGRVKITRIHLEEDTAKLIHKNVNAKQLTLVDFNRSGVPLVEIVSEPELVSGENAREFAQKLKQLMQYLDVSDCDMEKGSMRLEANVSLGLDLGYKVEVKNLNSFKFIKQAIDYELSRQEKLLRSNRIPIQETRGWSEKENKTVSQRSKETAADYRYFPEPDIPPLVFSAKHFQAVKNSLPQLPSEIYNLLVMNYKIRPQYAQVLLADPRQVDYLKQALVQALKYNLEPNLVAGEIVNKPKSIKAFTPQALIAMLYSRQKNKIGESSALTNWIDQAVRENKQAVDDYRSGKRTAIAVLIGSVMKKSKGSADAKLVKKLLETKL